MIDEEKETNVQEEPQIMSEREVEHYEGLTLNEQGETDQGNESWDTGYAHVRVIHLNELPLWKKVMYGIVAIGIFSVLAVMAWFAFLGFGVIAVVGLFIYFLRKLF